MANTPMQEGPPTVDVTTVDVTRKFVGVKEVGADGNVRFDFAIGWPELSVELALPQAAFDEFCRRNSVLPMPAAPAGAGEPT